MNTYETIQHQRRIAITMALRHRNMAAGARYQLARLVRDHTRSLSMVEDLIERIRQHEQNAFERLAQLNTITEIRRAYLREFRFAPS